MKLSTWIHVTLAPFVLAASVSAQNVVTNPGYETGNLSGWTVLESGGNGFQVNGYAPHSGAYDVQASYGWCRKAQEIDLLAKGFTAQSLDAGPQVTASEWYRSRDDGGPTDDYYFLAELRDASHQVIASWNLGTVASPVLATTTYQQAMHVFSGYGAGVRYVYIESGGKDHEYWSGWYGTVMDDASVLVGLSGTIDTQTWYKANSPYRVTGTITVPTGNTLTIEPGVDVLFDADVQFVVQGSLHAVGTETDSIRFLKGTAADWRGIRVSGGDSSTFAFSRISGGNARGSNPDSYGGGLYLSGVGTRVGMSNSAISGNRAAEGGGGVLNFGGVTLTMANCTLSNNTTLGSAGGVYNAYSATIMMTNCTISGNTASYGGGIANAESVTMTGCAIVNNTAAHSGGGVWNYGDAVLMLTNCTLAGNMASTSGGAIQSTPGTTVLRNTIVWGNSPAEQFCNESNATVAATYSDVQQETGVFEGTGNINANPLFINSAAGNYRLQTGSPCIDTGDASSPVDPDGTRADMGAFPFTHTSGTITSTTWVKANSPYRIGGTIVIPPSNTLTIEPGVDVLFDADVQFVVQGSLHAVGTETDSVRFIKGTASEWGGIRMSGGDSSLFAYVRISDGYADNPTPGDKGGGMAVTGTNTRVGLVHSVVAYNRSASVAGGMNTEDGARITMGATAIRDNIGGWDGGGLMINATAASMTDCIISGNTSGYVAGGISMNTATPVTMTNCLVSGNTSPYDGGGLYLGGAQTRLDAVGTVIEGNHSSGVGGGIEAWANAVVNLTNCTVAYNTAAGGGAFDLYSGGAANVKNTIIWGNASGQISLNGGYFSATYSDIQGGYAGTGNIDADPLFSAHPDSAYHLTGNSPCIDTGDPASPTDPDASRVDMGAYPFDHGGIAGTITTRTWTKASSPYHIIGPVTVSSGNTLTIEPGVDVLFDADVQFVVQGSLHAVGTETDSIRFLVSAQNDSAEWGGIRISGGDVSMIVYSRISGGSADSSASPNNRGGGIYLIGTATRLWLEHVVISGNGASWGGGVYNYNATLMMMNCTISGNSASGGAGVLSDYYATMTMTNCTISGNSAVISGGGGVFSLNYATLTMTNCTISGNSASAGGGVYNRENATLIMTNCTISGNSANYYGGGVDNDNATLTMTNCTISGNLANSGGGVCLESSTSTATLVNTILWGDSPDEIHILSGTVTATFSEIQGGYTGTGNINADPLFVDAANGDYHLQAGSPCIDAGDPATFDPNGTRADMGAFPSEQPGTRIEGAIMTSTWSAAGNPYYVTAQCTVMVGNVLTIEPGVEVRAQSDVAIIVEGRLVAIGAAGDTIRFLPYLASQWGGLRFYGGDTSTVQYAEVTGVYTQWGYGGQPPKPARSERPARRTKAERGPRVAALARPARGAREARPAYQTPDWGGAVVLFGPDTRLGMAHSRIHGNSGEYGGGVSVNDGAYLTATECDISANVAINESEGGGVYIYYGSAWFSGCTISANTASSRGGGVQVYAATAVFSGCTISGNASSYDGGGVFLDYDASADFTDCTISNNTATYGGGGGVYLYEATAAFTGSTIAYNAADWNGGGVHAEYSDLTFTGTTVSDNVTPSETYGGGLYLYDVTAGFEDCSITANQTGGDGGGLYMESGEMGTTVTMTGCTVSDNVAGYYGGGIEVPSGTLTMTDCVISGNSAPDDGGGVDIYPYYGEVGTFVRCQFLNNSGGDGGAMWIDSPVVLDHCLFAGNIATPSYYPAGLGGALLVLSGPFTATNCTFVGNEAVAGGGQGKVARAANLPGLGGAIYTTTGLSITNAIMRGNVPDEIADDGYTYAIDITYSDVQGDTVWAGEGNINLDPMFVDSLSGDYHLQAGSPCIDAGDPTTFDPNGTRADMGAFPSEQPGTRIEGAILTSTWSPSGNPFYVTGQCTVLVENVLTIEPGVEVRAQSDVAIVVEGRLNALGAAGDTIRFLPYLASQWGGLRFFGGDTSTVQYAEITGVYTEWGYGGQPDKPARSERPARRTKAERGARGAASARPAREARPAYRTTDYTSGGVAIAGSDTRLGIAHSRIHGNSGEYGGGMGIYDGAYVTATECDISSNTSTGESDGGGVGIYGASATFTGCTIGGNAAGYVGGGVCIYEGSAVFAGCAISANAANSQGGGVYLGYDASADFTDCTISSNTATYGGGGVYLYEATAAFTGSTIAYNAADWNGGGVYAEYSDLTFIGTTISSNTVASGPYGGGLYIYGGTLDFDGCSITGNQTAGDGGGLYMEYGELGTTVAMTGCTVSDNVAGYYGGGIEVPSGTLTMTDCVISGNSAPDDGGGVDFYPYYGDGGTFTRCQFLNNTGGDGGGMWIDSPVNLDHCLFAGNLSTPSDYPDGRGGGLYIADGASVGIANCTFASNEAVEGGGGGKPTRAAENPEPGTGGGAIYTATDFSATNAILWGNVPNQVAHDGTAFAISITYSDVQGGFLGAGNIDADPLFVDTLAGDFHLQAGSPCIDAGDFTIGWDPDGTPPEMGAYWFAQAGTGVSGDITSQTWTKPNSPYRVTGNIAVLAEHVLTIDAGVDVLFNVDVPFEVYGAMHALGGPADSIQFLPGLSGQWGGIRLDGDSSAIQYARISGGNAYDGGGLALTGMSTRARLSHAVVSLNNATNNGGGVSVEDGRLWLDHATLQWNGAGTSGGGLSATAMEGAAEVYGDSVTVAGNIAMNGAGGVFSMMSHVELRNSLIAGNEASGTPGGGIASVGDFGGGGQEATLILEDVEVSGNTAGDMGGGIFVGYEEAYLKRVTITNNTGMVGGGLMGIDSHVELDSCLVSSNVAASVGGIGTSAGGFPGTLILTDTDVILNTATEGDAGGIGIQSDIAYFTRTKILNNSAAYSAGGIMNADGHVEIVGSVIANNVANTGSGGGAYTENTGGGATFVLRRSTVTGNGAPSGGGVYALNDTVTIENSIIWSNGEESLVTSGGLIEVSYSDIEGGSGTGVIDVDPLFVDAPNGDYHLVFGSPCINAGNPDSLDADGTVADMGAFYRDLTGYVYGEITTTTWTAANSPYRVAMPSTVVAANTLTIEPGVDVLFDADVPLRVEGSIQALGTVADSIRFVKGMAPEWGGIWVTSADSCVFHYVRISGGHADGINGASAYGGGISVENTDGKLGMEHCVIRGNTAEWSGGGIAMPAMAGASRLTLVSCRIVGNTALGAGGGIFADWCTSILKNCLVAGNYAESSGGGLQVQHGLSTAHLANCTFADNATSGEGLGHEIYAYNETVTIENSIILSAGTSDLIRLLTADMAVAYSDIVGDTAWAGIGNINAAPLFVDSLAGDYRLQLGSPCIDTGDPASSPDLDGTRADMGAYPFRYPTGDVSLNGSVAAYDASLILQYSVRIIPSVNAVLADVTANGFASALDAALILYKVVNPAYVFPADGGSMPKVSHDQPRTLAWVRDGNGWKLMIDDPAGLMAGEFAFLPRGDDPVRVEAGEFAAYNQDGAVLRVAFARLESDATVLLRLERDGRMPEPPVIEQMALNDGAIAVARVIRPAEFALRQNVPNPFNPTTTIRFGMPEDGTAHLAIYSTTGQLVRTLVDGTVEAGSHEVVWDGTDHTGRACASGLYIYRLTSAQGTIVRRMVAAR